ncbi:hypothetical protein [Trichocoleus sp. FACHB-90]|nr:hypothetical protein [Trichocoleus sp. FACHB-90]
MRLLGLFWNIAIASPTTSSKMRSLLGMKWERESAIAIIVPNN